MFRFLRILFLAVVMNCVVVGNAYSNQNGFDKFNMSSGLSHNSALCLLEDHSGFVWIGTRDGLNRYDGTRFEVYKHTFFDSTSLVNNQINCLFETHDYSIWVGTSDGLCRYNPKTNKFQLFPLYTAESRFDSYYIRTIFETNDGKLWVGTTRGLYIINEARTDFSFVQIESEHSDLASNIRKIFQDSKGTVWLGTTHGLYRKTKNGFEHYFFDYKLNNIRQPVRDIVESNDGLLWLATEDNGVYVLDIRGDNARVEFTVTVADNNLPSDIVRKIYFESDEKVWLGTFGGLCIYNRKTQTINTVHLQSETGNTTNNSVYDIAGDKQSGIWVAIYLGGVQYYNYQNNMFGHLTWHPDENDGVGTNIVSVILEDNEQNLWIGTEGDGLYGSQDQGNTISEHIRISDSQISQNTIKTLALGNNHLWIGTLEGLSSYSFKSGKVHNYYHNSGKKESLNAGHVLALLYENKERIWVGTNGGGVQIFDPEHSSFQNIGQLENQHVRCFYRDSQQRVWIGCEEGVFLFDGTTTTRLSEFIKTENEKISDVTFITEDSQNNFWIGTRGMGLFLLRNQEMFWFNTSNGLMDNTINSLLEGTVNQYWITSNVGLARITVDEDETGSPVLSSETYSKSQGVQGLQFSPNCALKSKSGKLFFGGLNGINAFYPKDIVESKKFPHLVFTGFRIDYKPVLPGAEKSPLEAVLNETSEISLRHHQRDFSISFVGLNFINPDKNVYRYRVVGMNDSWVKMGSQNNINFTYFPVGTYEIRVQVSTNPDIWGTTYRSLSVTVLPPWWKTWWAFLLYSLLLIVLLGVFFLLSQRWAKMKNLLILEQFQREKESELNQLKLKFYTDVSHELRTPLTLILAPLENLIAKPETPNRLRNQLTQIQRSGFRLMQLVNTILDLRKLETGHEHLQVAEGNIIRFLTEISLAFKEVAAVKKINFEFLPHKPELFIWFDRDKLEIILNNLLSNAFKFTPAKGKVKLKLSEIQGRDITGPFVVLNKKFNYLQISVIDNGEGLNPADVENIYNRFYSKKENSKTMVSNAGVGLELTKRMIELHKGGISVSSRGTEAKEKETIFSFYLSLNKNTDTTEELDLEFKNSEDSTLYTSEFLQREAAMTFQEGDTVKTNSGRLDDIERLLVVEDNAEVRHFIKELFADHYEISEAENGESGLQKAIANNPQLIISDVMMPVMNGMELCRKIKTDPRTSHIPVILLTARTAVTFKYEGLETGADDYITKPFSARYLSLRVKNLIKQRKNIQEHFKRETICDPGSITLTSIDEKILKKAMDYITENISDSSISVNKISEHVGLSRVHFYRKIKALTNQTAVEFIRNVRLKRAATLLAQNKLSVKEVRNMVGFEDADYFRACFKEQFGATPTDFARKNI